MCLRGCGLTPPEIDFANRVQLTLLRCWGWRQCRTSSALGVSLVQCKDGVELPIDAHPQMCSITLPHIHTFPHRKSFYFFFFIVKRPGRETRQLRHSCPCCSEKAKGSSEAAGSAPLCPAGCRSVPDVSLTNQARWSRPRPTRSWEDVQVCWRCWHKFLGGLDGHLGAASTSTVDVPEPGSQQER